MKLAPKTAVVIRNEQEIEVGIEQVHQGDIFVVKPGENIPVDGIIIEGNSALNESALTGESIPVDKKEGDTVSAATLNTSGYLKCEATRVGEDTTLSQSFRWSVMRQQPKHRLQRLQIKYQGFLSQLLFVLQSQQ